jgi:lipoprotein-anchoring transpeptidase ErfK/SrfK
LPASRPLARVRSDTFVPGGIAFHGGSLTVPSHGCIHLDIGSARYYDDHLPVGAEVVVF